MIIGLAGRAGSGKNTVAKLMAEKLKAYGVVTYEHAFASTLKQVYELIFGEKVIDDQWWKQGLVPNGIMTRREALQRIGTDCMRVGLYEDVWVDALFNHIKNIQGLDPGAWHIITDVRFPNEYDRIFNSDGETYRVVRPDNPTPLTNHPSETALDNTKMFEILNEGTLEALKIEVDFLIDMYMACDKD